MLGRNLLSKKRNYKKGYYLERKIRKQLESQGYYVIRSAKSGGLFDLVAIGKREIRLIQVKKNLTNSEIKKFFEKVEKELGDILKGNKKIIIEIRSGSDSNLKRL